MYLRITKIQQIKGRIVNAMVPLIAGNWKMNGESASLDEIEAVAKIAATTSPNADILICPPSTLIWRATQTAAGRIAIGGQDCHPDICGAFTGDISAEMLRDAGATAVIVGHSERRQFHGEGNDLIAAKGKRPGAPVCSPSFASARPKPNVRRAIILTSAIAS